jgi:hypothetical protein
MLIYRGETMGLDEPAASLRLKGLRRGSQDYEYFWILSHSAGEKVAVDAAVDAVLHGSFTGRVTLGGPGMWKHDPDEWDGVRVKFGDMIEKLSRAH